MVKKISGGWHKGRSVYNPAANRLEAGTARILASAKWQRPEWRGQLCETIAENWLEGRSLPRAICTSVREAIAEIVRLETQAIELPQLASHSPTDVLIYRGRLNALAEFANRADQSFAIFAASLGKIFTRIAGAIPDTIARDTSPFTVPLIDLIEDPAQLVAGLASDLLRLHPQNPATILPGAVLAAQTKNALLKFNKTTEEAARKNPFKIISPQASGLTGTALAKAFLPEPFATLLAMPVPFVIPLKTWASHGVAFAPPNHGKSQLLSTVSKMFLDQPDPPGLIFLDPHGDVFKKLLRLDVFHPQHGRLKDRLVIFDAADEVNGPPKMNFLDTSNSSAIGAKSAFKFLMASLSAEWSPKQEAVAGYIFKLLQRIDGASIDTLRQLLDDKARSATASAFAAAIQALPEFDRDYFVNQFFDARMAETKTAMGWKIYAALDNETFRAMFSATHNSFNAYSIMQDKKICLVNGSQKTLGTDGMAVFLQFIVAQFGAPPEREPS